MRVRGGGRGWAGARLVAQRAGTRGEARHGTNHEKKMSKANDDDNTSRRPQAQRNAIGPALGFNRPTIGPLRFPPRASERTNDRRSSTSPALSTSSTYFKIRSQFAKLPGRRLTQLVLFEEASIDIMHYCTQTFYDHQILRSAYCHRHERQSSTDASDNVVFTQAVVRLDKRIVRSLIDDVSLFLSNKLIYIYMTNQDSRGLKALTISLLSGARADKTQYSTTTQALIIRRNIRQPKYRRRRNKRALGGCL